MVPLSHCWVFCVAIHRLARCWAAVVYIAAFAVLIAPIDANGQTVVVTGLVVDSVETTPLPNATVILLQAADSSLAHFSTTRVADGGFSFPRVTPGRYILQVSFVSMRTFYRSFAVEDENVDLGQVQLSPAVKELEEFVVTTDRLPFVVRGDTIEYHAMAFVVRPMDMVEDLLRRLPGIEVDRGGTIYAQGEMVSQVLVEEKEFFGKNPTIATRNLPAESVEHVQVYDKPSDRSELTGIPDGNDERTINLELTEEAKRAVFGQIVGGFGGDDFAQERYFGRASAFRFAPRSQLALLGGADNVNQPGFGSSEMSGFNPTALAANILGGSEGIRRSAAGGANATLDLGTNSDINASYFLVDDQKNMNEAARRHQSLGGSEVVRSTISEARTVNNLTHEVVINADVDLGEGHDMLIRGNGSFGRLKSILNGFEQTFDVRNNNQNAARTTVQDRGNAMVASAHATWRKRISDSGRSLVIESTFSARDKTESRDMLADTDLLSSGDLGTFEETRRLQELDSYSFRNSQRIELIQPLRSGKSITAHLERSNVLSRDDNSVSVLQGVLVAQDAHSRSAYDQNESSLRSGVHFNLSNPDNSRWVTVNMEFQYSWREGNVSYDERSIKNDFLHLLPNVQGYWKRNKNGTMNLLYRSWTRLPTARQAQPFEDRRNPLRVFVGNPKLKPEYWHVVNLSFQLYQGHSGLSLNTDAGVTYTHNDISRNWTIQDNGHQSISYINSTGILGADAGLLLGKRIRSLGLDWRTGLRANWDSGSEVINGVFNERRLTRMRGRVGLDYFLGRAVEAQISGYLTWNNVQYSINDALNRRYVNARIESGFTWTVNEVWTMSSTFEYRAFDRNAFAGQKNIAELDMALSRLWLGGRAEMELALNNVLDQDQLVRITNSAAYFENSQQDMLGRYLLFKITYKPKTI